MFEEGNILYFTPFYFKNGKSAPAPKFFIVLKEVDSHSILASLPTKKDSIPAEYVTQYGCVELPEINFNCFVISDKIEVTNCGKRFDLPTHIYGYQINIHEVSLMKEIYPIEGTDYIIWGKMKKNIFAELIKCLKESNAVPQKYIKILNR